MASTENDRTTRRGSEAGFGLLANGSSGAWEIAIDEATSGPDRWWAQIEGPSITFYFEIPSVNIVDRMIRFLGSDSVPTAAAGSMERNGSLAIGKDKKSPVTLVKDDEYEDRVFLLVGPVDNPTVRFVIAGTDVVKIIDALRQVKEDLDDKE